MAKKRKYTKRKSQKDEAKDLSGFWRGVGALILIIAGIVLGFGAFISAPIPHDFWHGAWWALGIAAIAAPFALVYLGSLKFITEDQRIPLAKMLGVVGFLVFFASWLHTAFLHHVDGVTALVGGHGGQTGKAIGDVLVSATGKFLASLIFFVLALFAALFTLSIEPKTLLKAEEHSAERWTSV